MQVPLRFVQHLSASQQDLWRYRNTINLYVIQLHLWMVSACTMHSLSASVGSKEKANSAQISSAIAQEGSQSSVRKRVLKKRKIFVKALVSVRVSAHKSQCTYEAGREMYELMNVTRIKQRYMPELYFCMSWLWLQHCKSATDPCHQSSYETRDDYWCIILQAS